MIIDTKKLQKAVIENKKNINEELADVGIFLLGIAEMLGSDLGEDIVNKMKINEKRIYKNGVKRSPH